MTHNIYNIKQYSSFRDNNGEPLNSNKISGDIFKITNELKKNNKGYHLCLKHDIKYILFADIDKVATIEEVKTILDVIASQLSIDVSKIKYSYCLKPSEDGELYSLHVSIPCLHATLKQQYQIFLDIKNIEPNGFGKYIDVSVYQNNKLFRLPYQTLREKPIAHNKLVNAELQDFILDYIPDDSVNIGSNGFTVQGKRMYKYDKNIKFNITDEGVTHILSLLPSDYLHDYIKWLSVSNILKGLKLKNVWEQWSMQSSSYNEYNNNKIWRGIKEIKFDLNYLINIINRNKEAEEKLEYLSTYKEFKPLQFNYNPVYVNDYRVTNIFNYDDFKQTRTAVIQSCTGTGKTTAIAKHMKEYLSNDDTNVYKVLSIIDKITLGTQHLESFKKEEIHLSSYHDGFKKK